MTSSGKTSSTRGDPQLGMEARRTLEQYAAATWRSLVAMTDPTTGLPADNIKKNGTKVTYTTPTNIACLLWSTLAAGELGLICCDEVQGRIARTLATLGKLKRFKGQYFNLYEPASGRKLTVFPPDGSKHDPFLSSVDNGWLSAALIMVRNAFESVPRLAGSAVAILKDIDLGFYYDSGVGHLWNGFWPDKQGFTPEHYDVLNTEARIASYVAIARGQVPPEHYFRLLRTFPPTWLEHKMRPVGVSRRYLGVDVYEGRYRYRDMEIVPTWGGSMFEALMVQLLVPEDIWAPKSWGINHPRYVRAQIEHGLDVARYGCWGFSPSSNPSDPEDGYGEYGVYPLGLNPSGYHCKGVVTPHAAFLALHFAPCQTLANVAKLCKDFHAYDEDLGFYDAVNVNSRVVAKRHLALDQGMIMMAIANSLLTARGAPAGGAADNRLQACFTRGEIEAKIRPLIAQEAFYGEVAV